MEEDSDGDLSKRDFFDHYVKDMGLFNKYVLRATHFPESEHSENGFKSWPLWSYRNAVGSYFAGNMTSDEQQKYGEAFGVNSLGLTLYNTVVNIATMYLFTLGSHEAGAEGLWDDYGLWSICAFSNGPKTYKAIRDGKGYQPWTLSSFIQNSTTYWNWALERGRGPAEALGIVPEYKGLENLIEKEYFEMEPDYEWEET